MEGGGGADGWGVRPGGPARGAWCTRGTLLVGDKKREAGNYLR